MASKRRFTQIVQAQVPLAPTRRRTVNELPTLSSIRR